LLLNSIVQKDLEHNQPTVYNKIWSNAYALYSGDSCTLARTSNTRFNLTDTTATFLEAIVGSLGVVIGFLPFTVKERTSDTVIVIEPLFYPESITENIFSDITPGAYSIGGFSPQIAQSFQILMADLTNDGYYPEAVMWITRQEGMLKLLQIYKSYELIFNIMYRTPGDKYHEQMKFHESLYQQLYASIPVYYNKLEENTTNEEYKTDNDIPMRR